MTVDELQAENFAKFMEDGPRLRSDYNVWIVAKKDGRVLLGGLGSIGVGQMWVDEEQHHKEYPGYNDAEVV